MNGYTTACLLAVCGFMVGFFIKFLLAEKKCEEYLNNWEKCADKLEQSYVDNSKLMTKLSEFQSKRDKHKKEQASWAKQKANLNKRIRELEENLKIPSPPVAPLPPECRVIVENGKPPPPPKPPKEPTWQVSRENYK